MKLKTVEQPRQHHTGIRAVNCREPLWSHHPIGVSYACQVASTVILMERASPPCRCTQQVNDSCTLSHGKTAVMTVRGGLQATGRLKDDTVVPMLSVRKVASYRNTQSLSALPVSGCASA